MVDKPKHDIATRAELDYWIEDRKNDPAVPEYNYPKPSWEVNSDDPQRVHMRMRERRIQNLTTRLDGAGREVEREFEQNR